MSWPTIAILQTSFEEIACLRAANRNPTKVSIFSGVFEGVCLFLCTSFGCLEVFACFYDFPMFVFEQYRESMEGRSRS